MDLDPALILPLLLGAVIINGAILAFAVHVDRTRRQQLATVGPAQRDDELRRAVLGRVLAPAMPPGALRTPADRGPVAEDTPSATPVPATEPTDPTLYDRLTGTLEAGEFHRLVVVEDGRVQRYRRPATIVVLELDGHDRLVDALGEDAGDRILVAVSDTIKRLARGADHVARLGPARFGVLLPETDEVAAINYIERVRRATELWLESGAIGLRLAIGWAGTAGEPPLPEAQLLASDRMFSERRRFSRRTETTGASVLDSEPSTPDPGERIAS